MLQLLKEKRRGSFTKYRPGAVLIEWPAELRWITIQDSPRKYAI